MTLRIIDIETTGVEAEKDAIIEIASVDLAADGSLTTAMQTFVDPERPIPSAMSALHHIIDADVAGAPKLQEAVEQFRGADSYVAHNARFEQEFFEAAEIDLPAGLPYICTFKSALRVWPLLASHSNQALRYHLGLVEPFGIPRAEILPHRASSDVIVTAGILWELLKVARWPDLIKWSREPALYTVLSFGKHRGLKYDEAPEDYIWWIIDKSDLDADVKFSARQSIERRRAARQAATAA